MRQLLDDNVIDFQQFKIKVIELTGLERDALHIYVGIGVFLITLMLTRKWVRYHRTRLKLALLVAIAFALMGEFLDLRHSYPNISGDILAASIHDIINTCFWPLMLYVINRWTPLFNKDD